MNIIHGNRNRILSFTPPRGEQLYDSVQTDTEFIVPNGVTSISIVAVQGGEGGGANYGGDGGRFGYKNNISVTPSETLKITVGIGGDGNNSVGSGAGGSGGHSILKRDTTILFSTNGTGVTASYSGGGGGSPLVCSSPYGNGDNGGGGGGAGGYSGNGGNANYGNGSGGAAGAGNPDGCSPLLSGSDYYFFDDGRGGGGTGLFGEGASGTGAGSGGSGGGVGSTSSAGIPGGGGGGGYERINPDGGTRSWSSGDNGGRGELRIIWGLGREFPSTDVALTV